MHPLQEKLLRLIEEKNIGDFTLRQIGELLGEKLPQKIKHHLSQLERKGFILIDKRNKKISRANSNNHTSVDNMLVAIPIVGSANCGPATIYADQNIEGYLKISRRLVPKKKGLFVIKAEGNSLNRASVNEKNIESGDYVIVDSEKVSPRDGDYVVSVIDGLANIKKYRLDKKNSRIALLSESTQSFVPIFLHEADDFKINGKVIDVVKKAQEDKMPSQSKY